MKQLALITSLLTLACTALCASAIAATDEITAVVPYEDEADAAQAPYIIFSNLGPSSENRYDSDGFSNPLSGKTALGDETETWDAVRFVPKVDVQAKVLMAAIQYISGARLVTLGIYTNNDSSNSVGDLLPGGEASTTQIPDKDTCCQLARVTLAGEGVTLTGGTAYWLVGKADDSRAPSFNGVWRVSNLGKSAYLQPPFPWNPQSGEWPAAQIRGSKLQTAVQTKAVGSGVAAPNSASAAAKVTIFTNLGPATEPYFPGIGALISGKTSGAGGEGLEALPFTPRTSAHAKTLAAAIAHTSGTKRVNLGLYTDNGGVPGTLLPGSQGSTTDFPDSGDCCDLAMVRLPGVGVALAAGRQYWLVASPDEINAPDFQGIWQLSTLALAAYKEPQHVNIWTDFTGAWFVAEIKGTSP
jgi:hypothetical protein